LRQVTNQLYLAAGTCEHHQAEFLVVIVSEVQLTLGCFWELVWNEVDRAQFSNY